MTGLPRDMRRFIRVNGVRLTNIDVRNCQPYLSILLFTNPQLIAEFARNKKFKSLIQNLPINQTPDIQKYISLVTEGILYEYLIDEFEARGFEFSCSDRTGKREAVKKMILRIMFDRNSHTPKYRKVFGEIFPEVHRIFSLVRGDERGDKFISYKRFAILLQTVESHVVLKRIIRRINRENKEIIAITIHDSIMTAIYTDHVKIVTAIMEEEFTQIVGYKPRLKTE